MSTGSGCITVRGIDVEIVYKDIKNLRIGVYPPAGRVRVAAPLSLDDDRVRLAVVRRLRWIREQRDRLAAAERQSEREMSSGESHHVWGRRLRLRIVERPGRAHIEPDGERLRIYVPEGTGADDRRRILQRWRRE